MHSLHYYLLLTERKHVEGRLPISEKESSQRKKDADGDKIDPNNQETKAFAEGLSI